MNDLFSRPGDEVGTWFGHEWTTEQVRGLEADVVTVPADAWSDVHRRRLLESQTIDGLVPTVGLRRTYETVKAFQLPAQGGSMRQSLDGQQISGFSEIVGITEAAARAAHGGHLIGLTHGAISTDDVRLVGDDVAILGMGLGQGGTPEPDREHYVAPEVAAGAPATPRSDVYSLGRVLENGLGQIQGGVPNEARTLIAEATDADPSRRPPSARAFANRLETLGGKRRKVFGLASLGRSSAAVNLAAALESDYETSTAVAASAAAITPTPAVSRRGASSGSDKSRRGAGILLAGLLGIGAVGLWGLSRDGSESSNDIAAPSTDDQDGADQDGADQDGAGSDEAGADASADAGDDSAGEDADVAGDDSAGEDADVAGDDSASDDGAGDDGAGDDSAGDDSAGEDADVAGDDGAGDDGAGDDGAGDDGAGDDSAGDAASASPPPAGLLTASEAAESIELLHAIPGVPIDAYLDGQLAAPGFASGTLAGPLPLSTAGQPVVLFAAVADPAPEASGRTDEPLVTGKVDIDGPGTLVAFLDEDGEPTLQGFVSDLEPIAAGQGRLVIRHVATDGPVTIELDGEPVAVAAPVGSSVEREVAAGGHAVRAIDGEGNVVMSQNIDALEGELTSTWIRGGGDGAVTTSIRRVGGLQSAPSGIPSGNAGLAASSAVRGLIPAVIMMILLGGTGVLVQQRRKQFDVAL